MGSQIKLAMSYTTPVDQRILDDYFSLISHRKTKDVGWLYGMIATYGLKPDELEGFEWNDDNSIHVLQKKRSINPLHPQWVLLFGLKEKQPRKLQDCWSTLSLSLYRTVAYQEVQLNLTDLLLAYRIRKDHASSFKKQKKASVAFAGAF